MKLCPVSAGLSLGVFWGICVLLLGVGDHFWQYGVNVVTLLGSVYLGFHSATLGGCFIGLVWGLADGFICGFILALLYNVFSSCCCKSHKCSCSSQEQPK